MIEKEEALRVHKLLSKTFGGEISIRDNDMLISALNVPFTTFGGDALYALPEEKAAALLESILLNKPFSENNLRTAYVLMRLLLLQHGIDLTLDNVGKQNFLQKITKDLPESEEIAELLKKHSKKV